VAGKQFLGSRHGTIDKVEEFFGRNLVFKEEFTESFDIECFPKGLLVFVE